MSTWVIVYIIYGVCWLISGRIWARSCYYDPRTSPTQIENYHLGKALGFGVLCGAFWLLFLLVWIVIEIQERWPGWNAPTLLRNLLVGRPKNG